MTTIEKIVEYIGTTKILCKYKENIYDILKHLNFGLLFCATGYTKEYYDRCRSIIVRDEPNYNFADYETVDIEIIKHNFSDSMAYIIRYSGILCHCTKDEIGIVKELSNLEEFMKSLIRH